MTFLGRLVVASVWLLIAAVYFVVAAPFLLLTAVADARKVRA